MNKFYKIIIMLFLNGIFALLAQTVFYREIMSQVYANELILGAMLSVWLFAGAFAGSFIFEKFFRKKNYSFLRMIFAILPVVTAFLTPLLLILIRYIKLLFGIQPEMLLNMWSAVLVIMAAASPISIVLTLGFSIAGEILRRENIKKQAKFMYIVEAAGAMIAGIIYTLFLSDRWGDFQIIYWAGVINIAAVYILFKEKENEGRVIIPAAVFGLLIYLGFMVSGFMAKADADSLKAGFAKYEVIYNKECPTAKITIGKRNGVYYVFENGMLNYTIPDIKYSEIAGWACLSHGKNTSVLNVNAGFAGMLDELSKYKSVDSITNIESDEYAGDVLQKYFGSGVKSSKKIQNIFGDPVYFMKLNPAVKYDTIILNLGLPNTINSNRFYTYEFLKNLSNSLNKNGDTVFYLQAAENYMNPSLASAVAAIYGAAGRAFKNIFLIPGDNLIFICSNDDIKPDATQMLFNMKKEGVVVPVLNKVYIEDKLSTAKQSALMDAVKNRGKDINSILKPAAYYAYITNDILMFRQGANSLKIALILFAMVFAIANTIRPKQITANPTAYLSMLAVGTVAMTAELILIFMFQSYFGYIYKYIGMIFAFFMLGCIAGGAIGYKFERVKLQAVLAASLILNLMIVWFLAVCAKTGSAEAGILILLVILSGMAAGLTFNLAIDNAEISMLYSMDLAGGAIAGLLFGIVLLPLLGAAGTIALNVVILAAMLVFNRYFGNKAGAGK